MLLVAAPFTLQSGVIGGLLDESEKSWVGSMWVVLTRFAGCRYTEQFDNFVGSRARFLAIGPAMRE